MATVKINDRSGFDALPGKLDTATVAALDELGAVAEGMIKENMTNTADSRGHRGRVASGSTRQATVAQRPRKTSRGYQQVTDVQSPQDKVAAIIEKRRRPGKGVSRLGQQNLVRWAKRKLGPVKADGKRFKPGGRAKAIKARVYLIARAIKKRGIPGIAPFKKAADALRKGKAKAIFRAALRRTLGGGK